jgi:hypothetical protein
MTMPHFAKLILTSSIALALSACGGSDSYVTPPVGQTSVEAGDVFALTSSNTLISFNRDAPATVRTSVAITGLSERESLLGIDYRPLDGMLYGVGSSGRIYAISSSTGVATLKSTLAADAADTSAPYTGLSGTEFGVDFNPVADRLRVVSNTGLNLRINVDTGATTTDGQINGVPNAAVGASAYTNSFATTASTTLYAIDAGAGTLYAQNPPNDGTLSAPVSLGVAATGVNGFDIDGRNNAAYAVLTVGAARNLYAINLAATSNAATLVAAVGASEDIRGIALRPLASPVVVGLTDDNRLVSFKPLTPNTLATSVAITGLQGGESLLGIDMRPKDGALYGITSLARIVTIDVVSGAATVKSTLAADALDTSAPYAGVTGTSFAVDFNPVADRLRVISDTGQNLRINVDSGATTTDGAINGAGAQPLVTGAAYTNSFAGTTTTMLFDIDAGSATLALQNPPNNGTLVNLGALGVNVGGDVGIDIAGGANGLVLAALRASPGAATSLYRINLTTGAATLVNGAANPALSTIGNGAPGLRDIAIALK